LLGVCVCGGGGRGLGILPHALDVAGALGVVSGGTSGLGLGGTLQTVHLLGVGLGPVLLQQLEDGHGWGVGR
jgi:hypothetical protein